jgi:apolipoprotein N-acyltransferase
MMHPGYRWAAAVTAGLILAAAFPKFGVAGLAWVAPGLMLLSALGATGRRAFRLGYVSGLAFHLGSLYWLLNIPVFKLAPIVGWIALSAFLALYSACWVWLCWWLFPAPPEAAAGKADTNGARWPQALDRFLEVPWGRRLAWSLSCALLWVTWEMVQSRFLSGFPWNLLSASQYRMVPIIQIASFTGAYGVSFLAVWFATSLLMAFIVVLRRSNTPRRWMLEILPCLLVLIVTIASGYRNSFRALAPAAHTRLALIQPSIPQQWIWSSGEASNRFGQLLELSQQAARANPPPAVVIWPEAAVPGFVRWDAGTHQAVADFARTNHLWLILGADDLERRPSPSPSPNPNSDSTADYNVFNASFLINPQGEFVSRYAKRRLVIFGEYFPFANWLPFLETWTGIGSFTPGNGPVPFVLPDLDINASVLICFEDVFPHLVREDVGPGTDFLLNLTNNGWFGEGAAQWQHAAAAVFRAVENGRPLVRCANNGLTCWVDAAGRMHDVYFPGGDDIYGRGIKMIEVPILDGPGAPLTFYTRHGDVFGWACVGLAGLQVLRRRKTCVRPPATGTLAL